MQKYSQGYTLALAIRNWAGIILLEPVK